MGDDVLDMKSTGNGRSKKLDSIDTSINDLIQRVEALEAAGQ
jgi:hypothetical protein